MIFLSYSWKDQAAAHTLDLNLRRRGFQVWIDFRELDLKRDITGQLEAAIRRCSLFVSLHSPQRTHTAWMEAERIMAALHARPVLHVPTTRLGSHVGLNDLLGYSAPASRCSIAA